MVLTSLGTTIVVYDIDNTLTNSKGEVSDRTKTALERAKNSGAMLIPCSGRMLQEILHVHEKFDLPEPSCFISDNGAVNLDSNLQILSRNDILSETVQKILTVYDELGGEISLVRFTDGEKIVFQQSLALRNLYNKRGTSPDVLNEVPSLYDFAENNKVVKIVLPVLPEKVDSAIQALSIDSLGIQVHRTGGLFLDGVYYERIEFTAKNVSKGNALGFLLSGIANPKIIVFGDSHSDLSMMEYSLMNNGIAVVVGNADDDVIASITDFAHGITDNLIVADTNDNDGVAKILEQLF